MHLTQGRTLKQPGDKALYNQAFTYIGSKFIRKFVARDFLCDYDQDWVWKVFSRFEHIASMQKAVVTS